MVEPTPRSREEEPPPLFARRVAEDKAPWDADEKVEGEEDLDDDSESRRALP
jgi:hypothetical protein